MATLALSALGAAAGSALLPAGISALGITLTGATLGSQVGALVGSGIDQALFGASGRGRPVDGPRLSDLHVTASTEGAPVPRLYGRARLGGQIIWATNLEEEAVESAASGGGKGGRGSGGAGLDYRYYANFAVGLCEGEITRLGRVWADGREIDLAQFTYRLYTGSAAQDADALISAHQGADDAPAYRGLAYIVFEHMPLAEFGNRIPQLSFEVVRAVDDSDDLIRGVCLIPGSGEFVYAQETVDRVAGHITRVAENVHTRTGGTDWAASLDQLEASLPNAKSVSLVVSWFGTDLRAGQCQLRPAVESADKVTAPIEWSVAGDTRTTALLVSRHAGRAAYGGTPSDQTVVAAIRELRTRGLSVVLSPFILMDVPAANSLADPYSAATSQPTYPWRGRITQFPAAGRSGSPDKSAAAAVQVAAFVGTAQRSHFSIAGDAVVYTGPAEWSFRRFILHYANLAKAAGGVDAFVLASELRGLTTIRSAVSDYPFVAALTTLAAEVRAILGPATKILYAADWSEYFGHQPGDGSGDVHFHLDPLWAAPDIDAIGIDVYWPLADWRTGTAHLDAQAGVAGSHELAYLKRNLAGGEGYDWYYASDAARAAQSRTAITDSAGKPWVFRFKDIRAWWSNAHYDRPAGNERVTPTAWVPQSKPFWLMEIGCPAIDKGANQPNVFVDAKSAESAIPYFSSGARDDFMQRRLIQAFTEAFDPAHAGYAAGLNPVSAVTGARMLDISRTHVYCWDARPYPAFPNQTSVWGDGGNWRLGHWLNGRLAAASVPALVARLLADYGFADHDATALAGTAQGLVLDRLLSAREALQSLELAFFFDALESGGKIVFRPRGQTLSPPTLTAADLVEIKPEADLARLIRAQETDLPAAAKIAYIAADADYAQAIAEARRMVGASSRVASASLALVLDAEQAGAIAESWLHEAWAARERATFTLPPSRMALEPGDTVILDLGSRRHTLRITETGEHGARDIEARTIDPAVYSSSPHAARPSRRAIDLPSGPPLVVFLDIPPGGDAPAHAGLIAAAQSPWPGTLAVFRSPEAAGYDLHGLIRRPAITGVTLSALAPGPAWRQDRATQLSVRLDRGTLRSVTPLALLAGANSAAIETAPDIWEVVQFETAAITAPFTYTLTGFLRGQRGSEHVTTAVISAGARFVLLDSAIAAIDMAADDVAIPFNFKVGPASRDIGDASYAAVAHTVRGVGLVPLAPVHIKATRNTAGDIALTWIRRTRSGGDAWAMEVPLGEDSERYEIDILAGAIVKRTLATTTTAAAVTAAMQTADFGSLQSALSIRIAQLSPTRGRGTPRTATV